MNDHVTCFPALAHHSNSPYRAEAWVIHGRRQIYVTDFPGPPSEICGYVSEQARANAVARGHATVSEIGFPSDVFLGAYDMPSGGGWGEVLDVAKAKAGELGYEVVFELPALDEDGSSIREEDDDDAQD